MPNAKLITLEIVLETEDETEDSTDEYINKYIQDWYTRLITTWGELIFKLRDHDYYFKYDVTDVDVKVYSLLTE